MEIDLNLKPISRYQIIAQFPGDKESVLINSKEPYQAFSIGGTFGLANHLDRETIGAIYKIAAIHRQLTDTPEGWVDSVTLVLAENND